MENKNLDINEFYFEKGEIGCLLIHGFSGSPPEMRLLGNYLAEKNLTVYGCRLKGHGTSAEDFATTNWKDWVASAEEALKKLQSKCKKVFVLGLSMGGAITLHLAANCEGISAVVTLSAAAFVKDFKLIFLPIVSKLVKFFPATGDPDLTDPNAINYLYSYEKLPLSCVKSLLDFLKIVREEIPKVKVPIFVMHGLKDKTLTVENANFIYNNAGSTEKEIFFLDNSGHGITVDSQKEIVFEKSYNFIKKYF